MPWLSPHLCATLLALLQAIDAGQPAEAIRAAWSLDPPERRHALTLINAAERGCRECLRRVRSQCEAPNTP